MTFNALTLKRAPRYPYKFYAVDLRIYAVGVIGAAQLAQLAALSWPELAPHLLMHRSDIHSRHMELRKLNADFLPEFISGWFRTALLFDKRHVL